MVWGGHKALLNDFWILYMFASNSTEVRSRGVRNRRGQALEGEAETNETLLGRSRKQASFVIVCND